MSKKIDESFLSNFATNMAIFVTAKVVSGNSDKAKKALGIDSDDSLASAKKAQDRLAKSFQKRLEKLSPEKRKDAEKYNDMIKKALKHK